MTKCGIMGETYLGPTKSLDSTTTQGGLLNLKNKIIRGHKANQFGGNNDRELTVFQTTQPYCPATHQKFNGTLQAASIAHAANKLNRHIITGGSVRRKITRKIRLLKKSKQRKVNRRKSSRRKSSRRKSSRRKSSRC